MSFDSANHTLFCAFWINILVNQHQPNWPWSFSSTDRPWSLVDDSPPRKLLSIHILQPIHYSSLWSYICAIIYHLICNFKYVDISWYSRRALGSWELHFTSFVHKSNLYLEFWNQSKFGRNPGVIVWLDRYDKDDGIIFQESEWSIYMDG